jgi:prevent-host-death family protein
VHDDPVDTAGDHSYALYKMYEEADEHRTAHVSVSEARQSFADLVNRVAYRNERVLVTRHGRPIAAIVPMEQVEFLERAEDAYDLLMAEEARKELDHSPAIPWEQVKRDLGL